MFKIINNTAHLTINKSINSENVTEWIEIIEGLEHLDNITNIDIMLSTEGGNVVEGFKLYESIKKSTKHTTIELGLITASIGSVIMLASNILVANPYSNVMIHNPFFRGDDSDDEILDIIKNSILAVYKSRFGENESYLMDVETWFNYKDLIKLGLVEENKYENENTIYNGIETKEDITMANIINLMEMSNNLIKDKHKNMKDSKEDIDFNPIISEEIVEVEETVEDEVVEDVIAEVEDEVVEDEVVEDVIAEDVIAEVEDEVIVEDSELVNKINKLELINKELLTSNLEMKAELDAIDNTKKIFEKESLLESLNIRKTDAWMKLELSEINNLVSDLPNFTNSVKIETPEEDTLKYSMLDNSQRAELEKSNPELLTKLFWENK